MKINFLNKALISLILISSFTRIVFLNNNNNNNNNNKNSNVTVKQIESGVGFSGLVLNYDNSDHLYMWGRNDYGQLGIGNTTQQITPQEVDINQDGILGNEGEIHSFSIGGFSNLLWSIDSSGDDHLYSWGRNQDGNLGIGQSSSEMPFSPIPVEIPLDYFLINREQTKIQKIAISEAGFESGATTYANDIVITMDNFGNEHLFIWGNNSYGQLGNSAEISSSESIDEPFEFKTDLLENGKEIQEIEIGYGTIGMVIDNSLYTWGSNVSQEMGIDEVAGYDKHPTPSLVNFDPDIEGGGADFVGEVIIEQIDFSEYTSAAVLSDSNGDYLYTWGNNYHAQLGEHGDTEHFKTPQRIENIPNGTNVKIKKIFTNPLNTAVIIEDEVKDKLLISGDNAYGQFGGGDNNFDSTKEFIECDSIIEDKIINLSLNFGSLIINTIDDSNVSHLYSWGKNTYGQLGLGVTEGEHFTPQELKDFIPSPSPKFETISTPVENSNSEFQMKVDYSLSLNSLDDNFFKENYINKIEVVDGRGGDGRVYGSINSSEDVDIPLSGSIDLDGLILGNNYSSGDLYLKATYNDNLIFGDPVPEFIVPKNDAALPTFVSATTVSENPFSVHYSLNVPIGDSTTEDTIINKIEVTNGGDSVLGSVDSSQGEIPNSGEIILDNINNNSTYENYYLVVHSNAGILNADGTNPFGNIPTIITLDPAIPPTIVSTEVFDITAKSAIVKYEISIPEYNTSVEDTILTKISIIDSSGNIYEEISDKKGLNPIGEIELTLKPSQTYEGLYLEVIYNGNEENPIGGSEIESSLIPSFKTKINPMIIYGSGALLILIIILIIIIIIIFLLIKKAKTEKNYHINKSKK